MSPKELADESYLFLTTVLMEAYHERKDDELPEAFAFRHARNVQAIGRDVIFLYENQRFVAAQISVRSMLESMFCVVACAKVPTFPEEKLIAECEYMVKMINKTRSVTGDADLDEPHDTYKNLADSLRKKFGVTSRNDWNVFNVAQAAKLESQYTTEYFLHCGYVHATTSGIISQEHEATVGHSYQTAVATMIITGAHAAALLETNHAQAHVDNGARLLGVMADMIKQGEFRDAKNS